MIITKTNNPSLPYALTHEGATVEMVARVSNERLARQFAASAEMLAICKKFVEFENSDRGLSIPDWDLLTEAFAMAAEVVERVEGE